MKTATLLLLSFLTIASSSHAAWFKNIKITTIHVGRNNSFQAQFNQKLGSCRNAYWASGSEEEGTTEEERRMMVDMLLAAYLAGHPVNVQAEDQGCWKGTARLQSLSISPSST